MEQLRQIIVKPINVVLANNYLANNISAKVELASLWSEISKYTDLIVKVTLRIPLIENHISKEMILQLDGVYKVNTLDKDNPYVIFSVDFPGEIDISDGKKATGVANIINYNIV